MEEYGSYKLGFRYRTRLRKNERAREGERIRITVHALHGYQLPMPHGYYSFLKND